MTEFCDYPVGDCVLRAAVAAPADDVTSAERAALDRLEEWFVHYQRWSGGYDPCRLTLTISFGDVRSVLDMARRAGAAPCGRG